MPFIQRLHYMEPKPFKIYLHETGYAEIYGRKKEGIIDGIADVVTILISHKSTIKPADYVLAALYGNKGERVVEMFGYGDVANNWKGNPTVYTWVFRNGVYMPEEHEAACGDMMIAFGREEEHRRKQSCLGTYMATYPELPQYLWTTADFERV